MNLQRAKPYLRFLVVFALLGAAGLASVVYILIDERFRLPFSNTINIKAQFTAADGLVAGLGQPVNVAGVHVGEVTNVSLQNGTAVATLQLDRGKVPRIYANATAALQPITPLNDMQIELNPGGAPAKPLAGEPTIAVGQTTTPTPLSDLLSSLDVDTRAYLTSLITSLGAGTAGRAPDIRAALQSLGPTAGQLHDITAALAGRRTELARLVHNLALITHAASQDRQLASVVLAGNQTLHAVATQDTQLRQAIAELPPTLAQTRATLTDLTPFANKLKPTLNALLPALDTLPASLGALRPFATQASSALQHQIRPFVRAAEPLLTNLEPAVKGLHSSTPNLSVVFQALQYVTNELAYNPGGNDQGFLSWTAWALHNMDSVTSGGDANGGFGRGTVLLNCFGLQGVKSLQPVLGLVGLCPK